jgi:hypothetical protein
MTNAELKDSMMAEEPVIHRGVEYKRVSAIIYRKSGSGVQIQAELLDKNENSVSIADPKRVERKMISDRGLVKCC